MSRDTAVALANKSFALMDEIDAALRESSAVRMAPVFERVLTNNGPVGLVEAVDWDLAPESAVRVNMTTITSVSPCACPEHAYTVEVLFNDVATKSTMFSRECIVTAPEKELIGLIAYGNGIVRDPLKPHKRHEEGRRNVPPHLINNQPQISNHFLGTNSQYFQNFVREDLWDLYDIPSSDPEQPEAASVSV